VAVERGGLSTHTGTGGLGLVNFALVSSNNFNTTRLYAHAARAFSKKLG